MLNLFVQKQPKTGELVSTVEKCFSMTLVRKTEAILCIQGMHGCNREDSRFAQPFKSLGDQRSQGPVPKFSSAPEW